MSFKTILRLVGRIVYYLFESWCYLATTESNLPARRRLEDVLWLVGLLSDEHESRLALSSYPYNNEDTKPGGHCYQCQFYAHNPYLRCSVFPKGNADSCHHFDPEN